MIVEEYTIGDLPPLANAEATDIIAVMRAGASGFITVDQLSTLVLALVVDGSPSALDTLKELAAALGDDPNFATTIANTLALKADAATVTSALALKADAAAVTAALALRLRVDAAQSFTAAQQAQSRANDSSALKGHVFGLGLSNNVTDTTNDIDIAAGEAASTETNPVLMVLAAGITKRLDAAWAVGSGNGGLDTGSIANTTYHVWLIRRSDTGVVDVLFSTSATSPTMPTNYDQKRRIGSIIRSAGTILPFQQSGDIFKLGTQIADRNAAAGTYDALFALTVPAGVVVEPILNLQITNGSAGTSTIRAADALYGKTITGQAAAVIAASEIAATYIGGGIFTNSASQIWLTITGGSISNTTIYTSGWIDQRGKAS